MEHVQLLARFYSLQSETCSGTTAHDGTTWNDGTFLFAAERDVQRNPQGSLELPSVSFLFAAERDVQRNSRSVGRAAARLVSIHCRARRAAELMNLLQDDVNVAFLFAAERDVQRRPTLTLVIPGVPVSIRCRARRAAELHA